MNKNNPIQYDLNDFRSRGVNMESVVYFLLIIFEVIAVIALCMLIWKRIL
jgi:hypothetical protein|nr:MAG TPA: hypothetical protein [Bacteriophage sp.]